MKNLVALRSYFDYIFVHLRQKPRLRPELSPKFLSALGPNLARTRPEKPSPTYNSALGNRASSEEKSQRWRAVCSSVFDLTGPGFEP